MSKITFETETGQPDRACEFGDLIQIHLYCDKAMNLMLGELDKQLRARQAGTQQPDVEGIPAADRAADQSEPQEPPE